MYVAFPKQQEVLLNHVIRDLNLGFHRVTLAKRPAWAYVGAEFPTIFQDFGQELNVSSRSSAQY